MKEKPLLPTLGHIVDAIGHIREVTEKTDAATFEKDWRQQWLVERGVSIISEATRDLPADLKVRYSEIPWKDIAGVGSVL
jgi:uncharacterized protein with HEPN domain